MSTCSTLPHAFSLARNVRTRMYDCHSRLCIAWTAGLCIDREDLEQKARFTKKKSIGIQAHEELRTGYIQIDIRTYSTYVRRHFVMALHARRFYFYVVDRHTVVLYNHKINL